MSGNGTSETPDLLDAPGDEDGADVPDVAEDESELPDTSEDTPTDEDGDREPDVDEVELDDDDLGGDDLFAGLEDADDGSEKSSSKTDDDGGPELSSMATRVNEGAAKLAVAGLEEDEQERLQADLEGAFELFQLGYFAEETVREYVITGEDEIDPAWGLLGSSFCCLAIVLAFRPDGGQKVAGLRRSVRNIGRGA